MPIDQQKSVNQLDLHHFITHFYHLNTGKLIVKFITLLKNNT